MTDLRKTTIMIKSVDTFTSESVELLFVISRKFNVLCNISELTSLVPFKQKNATSKSRYS